MQSISYFFGFYPKRINNRDRSRTCYLRDERVPSNVLRRPSSISRALSPRYRLLTLQRVPFHRHEILEVRRIGTQPDTQRIPDATPKRRLFIAGDVFRRSVAWDKYFGRRINSVCVKPISLTRGRSRDLPKSTQGDINWPHRGSGERRPRARRL